MKKMRLIVGMVGVFLFVTLVGNAAWSEQIVLRYAGQLPVTHHLTQADYRFAKMVGEKTNGKVRIEVYPAGQLYKGSSIVKAVMSGAVEMGIVFNGALTGPVPLMDLFELHFIFRDYDHILKAWNGEVGEKIREEMEKNNIKALGFDAYGDSFSVVNKQRPVKMPKDFKGLKIRAAAPMHAEAVRALDASPVMMSSSEVYMALQRGTIDGAISGPTSIEKRKWYESAKYITLPGAGYSLWPIMINLKVWKGLPPDVQGVMQEVALDTIRHTMNLADIEDQKAVKLLSEKVEVYTLNQKERQAWKDAVEGEETKVFLKRTGKDGKNLIKLVKEM